MVVLSIYVLITAGFRLADFLYRKEEMPAKKIDYLLEIWALKKAKTNNLALFNSYTQMYSAIDVIEFGDAPWQSVSMSFADDDDHPADTPRKSASYKV
jgi:Rad3-related DNA helicase